MSDARTQRYLFDLDGTLLDHEGASASAVVDAVETWMPGVPVDPDAARAEWSRLERVHMAEYLAGRIDFREQRRRRLRGLLGALGGPDLVADDDADAAFESYLDCYTRSWVAFDDVGPALRRLVADGAELAILSNGDREQQLAKVAALHLPVEVDVLVPADVGAAKPAAGAFVRACELLGWTPSEVTYVGDSFDADVRGGAAAGLRACWLNRSGGASPDPAVAHTQIRTLHDLGVAP